MTAAPALRAPLWWSLATGLCSPAVRLLQPGRFRAWPRSDVPTVWLHAASLGETKGLLRLAAALDGVPLTLTATTASGLQRLRAERPDLASGLLPWDAPGAVEDFLEARRVAMAVLLEAELWPTACAALSRRGVPSALAAARCSPRSRRRWRLLARAVPGLTESVTVVWADGPAARLAGCGFQDVRDGASLKWAGAPRASATPEPGRLAAISFHARHLPALLRLARSHPRAAWSWFPRRTVLAPLARATARLAGLRPVPHEAIPGPGEVWIAPRLGLVRERLPGCEAAWVAPGHDAQEPSRLGVPRLLNAPEAGPDGARSPEATLREVVSWIRSGLGA